MEYTYEELLIMADDDSKTIGRLNGPWSIMFRIALATYPIVVSLMTWLVANQFADNAFRTSERFTPIDAARLEARLTEQIGRLPPQEWKDRIVVVERNQQELLRSMTRIETKLESKGTP